MKQQRTHFPTALKWLMLSQSMLTIGAGVVFPFYLILIKDIGGDFSQYGIAYGLFTLSAALLAVWFGKRSDRYGRTRYLLISAWGMSIVFLMFPLATGIIHIYVLQVLMGIFGAMQRVSERALAADLTDQGSRGEYMGKYQLGVSAASGIAVIAGGFFIDLFTLDWLFYAGSMLLFIGGLMIWRLPLESRARPEHDHSAEL
ncbi:MFS transporter [Paenibacillus aquistagni]|uniref:MFS transporter n=1 Tax=Paenibacillus aquistagni TaxID=1852522 RepID=UPI00145B736B|nr:MFS transporter [Paenibacillus aquistagni]NMM51050.1 MFS transporter [Paenibacillus aquistagni]